MGHPWPRELCCEECPANRDLVGGKWRAGGPARLGGEGAPGCQEVRGWRGWATDGEPGGHTRLAFAKVPLASWRSRQGPWVVGGGWQPSRQELGASYKSCIKEGCAWQLRDGAKGEAGGPGGPRTCSLSIRSMQGALLKWKGRCPGLGRWAVWAGSGSSRVSPPSVELKWALRGAGWGSALLLKREDSPWGGD